MRQKIQSIQNLRGFAALLVLIHHIFMDTRQYGENSFLINNFYALEYFGNIGVDIFFVISGFIMVLVHGNDFLKPHAVRIFLIKRIIRVVPLYWILSMVSAFLLFFFPHLFGAGKMLELHHAVSSFFFIPSRNTAGDVIPILSVGWTLNFEMYFYMVFSLFLFFPKRVFIPGITLFFIASISLHVLNPTNTYLVMITNPLLIEFLLGVYIGALYLNRRLIKPSYTLIIMCGMLFFSNIFLHPPIEARMIYFGIPSALLLYVLISYENYKGDPLCGNKFSYMGTISYSLYLSHIFVYKFVIKAHLLLFGAKAIDIMILFAILASIIGAILVYNFIEKPITLYLTARYTKKDMIVN